MFTGIIQETGEILVKEQSEAGSVLEVAAKKLLPDLKVGDSISVDGVCLTVREKKRRSFTAEATPETLRRSNLGERRKGDRVNLEPSTRLADFLGGHLVQGHVDAAGEVTGVATEGNSKIFRIAAPKEVLHYCTLKGSISVNGVSLTISALHPESFEVTIIPYTLEVTNFRDLCPGDRVNLEADVMSKYVESHVRQYVEPYLKRLLGVFAAILLFAGGIALGNDLSLGPHSVIVYENRTGEGESQFVIRLGRYRPDIFLEWESTSHQGLLHLYREAVEKAKGFTLTGLFEVGVNLESSDLMTVWLSDQAYLDLIQDGKTEIQLNRISAKMELEGEGVYPVIVNGESLEVPVLRLKDTRRGTWTLLKDPENPLILEYVSPYFRQSLKRVSTAKTNKFRWIKDLPPVK